MLLVAVGALALVTGVGTSPATAGAPPAREVHVAYYPWYGNPTTDGSWSHWTHPVYTPTLTPSGEVATAPDDIGANWFPEAGLYSSLDPATLDRQMGEIAAAGIDVVVSSWWGPGSREDVAAPLILDAAATHGLEVTFLVEPGFATALEARDWIIYLIDTYGGHAAFHRSDHFGGRPLLYTFTPFKLDAATVSFLISPEDWAEVLQPDGASTIRGTAHDAAVVGHIEVPAMIEPASTAGFDAVNTYFASGVATTPVGVIPVSGDPAQWPTIDVESAARGMDFIPSVGPGYIDERIRPWNDAATRDRSDGAYYAGMVDAACRLEPAIISVTSYNEWHEGTQIEPAVAHTTPVTSYPAYDRGPDQYLDQTRAWADAFRAGTLCQAATTTTTASTTTTTIPTSAAPPPTVALPVTGARETRMAVVGSVLVAMGLLLILAAARLPERDPARR